MRGPLRKAAPALALALALGVSAQESAPGRPPLQGQIINFNVLEALVAIEAPELGGLFSFIPDASAPMALADYLLHDAKALRRFVRKGEKDLAELQAVSDWDKQVCLYLVGIGGSPTPPPGATKIPAKLMERITELSLAPAAPREDLAARRASSR